MICRTDGMWHSAKKIFDLITIELPIKLVNEDPDLNGMQKGINSHLDNDPLEALKFEEDEWVSIKNDYNISMNIISNKTNNSRSYHLYCSAYRCFEKKAGNNVTLKHFATHGDDISTCTYQRIGDLFKKTLIYGYENKQLEEVKYYDLEGNITTIEDINNKPNSKALAR